MGNRMLQSVVSLSMSLVSEGKGCACMPLTPFRDDGRRGDVEEGCLTLGGHRLGKHGLAGACERGSEQAKQYSGKRLDYTGPNKELMNEGKLCCSQARSSQCL